MTWAPAAAARDLIAVLPVWLDVNNEVGGTNTFDLTPGKSMKSYEFVAPVGGRITRRRWPPSRLRRGHAP